MATYKVIQDIEAEDKFLGPLTLKQFIFGSITVVCLYLSFFFITKHVWFLVLPLLPIMLVGGFLAFPWGRDQPTEIWLLAKLRFWFKPHLHIWDQSGLQELVTITAPKKAPDQYTSDNLSKTEVKSRLKALADTIDTRGWAVKNMNINMTAATPYVSQPTTSSDRLIDIPTGIEQAAAVDVHAADDIMDEHSNPVAQKLDQMIGRSGQAHRRETLDKMEAIRGGKLPAPTQGQGGQKDNFWFMEQPSAAGPTGYTSFGAQAVGTQEATPPVQLPQPVQLSADDMALLDKLHKEQSQPQPAAYGHMKVIDPLGAQRTSNQSSVNSGQSKNTKTGNGLRNTGNNVASTSGLPPDPAILQLANNDDLTVATIARQAGKGRKKEPPADEVVVSLH